MLPRCRRKHAYLPWLMNVNRCVSFTNMRKTKTYLNAFFRQPVVSPYPTGMGLDFLGVTTKAHFPLQAVGQSEDINCMQNVGCLRRALVPYLAQPYRCGRPTLFWDGMTVEGSTQAPNPHCICPNRGKVSRLHPLPSRCCLGV